MTRAAGPKRRAAIVLAATLAVATSPAGAEPCLRGVNLSGAEFGQLPGRPNVDYAYPTPAALAEVSALGATAIRLPFRWDRLQPKPRAAFDPGELARLDATVKAAIAAGLVVVVDPHDFGYYHGHRIGSAETPVTLFADFWARLARHFKGEPQVVLSLMNEPYDIAATDWAEASNAAIAAIRKAGALQLVLVPGTAYTGAHSWSSDLATGRNDRAMLAVSDPLGRMAFDFHQYLDGDFSGRTADCPGAARALKGIDDVTAWLKANGRRGFLGEFAASERPDCVEALTAMVEKVNAEPTLWVGWTAWGAGAWWPKDYLFNLDPTDAGPRPQMAALKPLMADGFGCDLAARP